mgnify:CR=1 FL=1
MYKKISKEETISMLYSLNYTQEDIDIIFAYHTNHPIVVDGGALKWKQTINYEKNPELNPNNVAIDYMRGKITQKEYMEYNRKIGYSLYGYWGIFYFNNKFDLKQYEKDMQQKLQKQRELIINDIINE